MRIATRMRRYIEAKFAHDADSALRLIKTSPDVIANFPYAGRNHPAIAELLDSREFVLEVLDPTEHGSGKYDWSGILSPDWRRLNYLPEHWRSDKEVMLLAVRCECQILSDKKSQQSERDRGKEDWHMIAAPMLFGDFERLFAIARYPLMSDPAFLAEVEDHMTSFFGDEMGSAIKDYFEYRHEPSESDYQMEPLDLSWTSIEELHETSELLINGLDGFWDPLSPPAKRATNPVPDCLLQAVRDSRGVIDFYRATITDKSDREIIKVVFHDALEALSLRFVYNIYGHDFWAEDPFEFCFGFENGISDLCNLIPDELLNDPKMLLEVEQALIAMLAPRILDGTYEFHLEWDDIEHSFLEEQELDEFPSLDSLANLKVYLDAMEDDTVSPLDYDNSRVLSHPIPDRLLNAVSNAREEIDALAAEKES
jgi:hypothetical protein